MSQHDAVRDAYKELIDFLEDGEEVEAVSFGHWKNDDYTIEMDLDEMWNISMPRIPVELRGKPMPLKDAEPHMRGWSFYSCYGGPETYAFTAWTNKRVIFVIEFDNRTELDSVLRNPVEGLPWFAKFP